MKRYINVTTIDATGSPTSTQIFTDNITDAIDHVEKAVADAHMSAQKASWRKALVAAFIYDSGSNVLVQYIVRATRLEVVRS